VIHQAIFNKYVKQGVFGGLLLAFMLCCQLALASERGLLWQVTGPAGSVSYLMGTLHSEDPRVMALAEEAAVHLQRSRMLILELVPDLAMSQRSLEYMLFNDQRRLSSLADKKLYEQAAKLLRQHDVPQHLVDRMKPWAVYIVLSMPRAETGMFLDMQLYGMARQNNITVTGLESIEEQLGIFDNMPMPEQLRLMRETIKEYPNLSAEFDKLMQAYLSRDLGRLLQVADSQIKQDDPLEQELEQELEQQLVHDRNLRMAERLRPYLDSGGVFIAVGALHLPGPTGLLALLRQQDYQLEAVF
jgi:uncharacterized protein YbaP (TraB family)